jgi:hypothetical protein
LADASFPNRFSNQIRGDGFFVHRQLHQLFVERVEFFEHDVSPIASVGQEFLGDVLDRDGPSCVFGAEAQEFHIDQIDDRAERIIGVRGTLANRDLNRDGFGP